MCNLKSQDNLFLLRLKEQLSQSILTCIQVHLNQHLHTSSHTFEGTISKLKHNFISKMVYESQPQHPSSLSSSQSISPPTSPQPQPQPRRLNTTRRDLYFHHENVTESLAGKDEQYRHASKRAHKSNHRAKSLDKSLSTIRAAETSLSVQLEQWHARRLRNFLFRNRAAMQKANLQNELSVTTDKARAAKEHLSLANLAAERDASAVAALRTDAKAWRLSERTRRAILEKAFGGQDAGSAAENSIETKRDHLATKTVAAKEKFRSQNTALALLKAAGSELLRARKGLLDAQLTNTVDLFSSSAIGFVAGLSSQYHVKVAGNLARRAGRKVQRALELNPSLPIYKMANVNDSNLLTFADILLDGVVTDLLIRITIQKSVRSIDSVLVALKESIEEQTQIVNNLDNEAARFSSDLKRTSEDLVQVRTELIHEQTGR